MRRALDARRIELDATKSKSSAIQSEVTDLGAERERLNARLVETAALVQRSESQLTAIEGRLIELEAQKRLVEGSLGQRHGQIAVLLGALQRMGRNPPPVLITRREDALQMVRSAMLLSSAFPELREKAVQLSSQLDELGRVAGEFRTEGEKLQAETDRLNESRNRLASLMEAKKLTIAERRNELMAAQSAAAELSKSVEDLSQLFAKISENPAMTAKPATEVTVAPDPAGEAPTPSQVATAAVVVTPDNPTYAVAEGPAPSGDGKEQVVAALQPPALKPQIVEIAPSQAAFSSSNPGRIKPAMPFTAARAKLPLPAHGRRALNYGERTQYGGQSKGMVLETRSGAQITSPCDGWIVYAGEFRSYGQLLIINAGDGYHILLAGMSRIDVQPGQFVLAAEPVGTMAGGTKPAQTQPPGNSPVLYVEFRKDGRPIDPEPWWATGQQKVQG